MSERKKVEDRLRKKEQEITSLEDKIRAARIYVTALRDILKMFGPDNAEDEADAESTLRSGSAVDKARRVILEKGVPLHIDEILEALGKDVTRDTKASLTSSLAAYVRRREIFTRPAPNTFGLTELGHELDEQEATPEPPYEFGRKITNEITDDDIPF